LFVSHATKGSQRQEKKGRGGGETAERAKKHRVGEKQRQAEIDFKTSGRPGKKGKQETSSGDKSGVCALADALWRLQTMTALREKSETTKQKGKGRRRKIEILERAGRKGGGERKCAQHHHKRRKQRARTRGPTKRKAGKKAGGRNQGKGKEQKEAKNQRETGGDRGGKERNADQKQKTKTAGENKEGQHSGRVTRQKDGVKPTATRRKNVSTISQKCRVVKGITRQRPKGWTACTNKKTSVLPRGGGHG